MFQIKRRALSFASFMVLMCCFIPSASIGAQWESLPIFGGEMTSIAVDPFDANSVYVGTRDGGVFKTIDGGASWAPARNGLTFYPIRTLLADPNNEGTLYAGTDYDGIYKTNDGGLSWTKQSTGLDSSMIVGVLAINPTNSSILFAGLAGGVGLCIGNIYKSIDGGESWTVMDQGIPRYSDSGSNHTNGIFSLAVNPTNSNIVYAGTNFHGAYVSINGGTSWSPLNNGMPGSGPLDMPAVKALGVNPHDGHLYAVVYWEGYFRLDTDNYWLNISNDSAWMDGSHIHFDPVDSSTIYLSGGAGRCLSSTDGGITWAQKLGHPESGRISEISFHPSQPSTIFAASDVGLSTGIGGVYKSTDGGENWDLSNNGITAANVTSVAVAPSNPSVMFAGTSSGVIYRSIDGGHIWTRYIGFDYNDSIDNIKVDPTNENNVYAATSGDLYRSEDKGETFTKTGPMKHASVIAFDTNSSTMFVGCEFGEGIYRSKDGINWDQINKGFENIRDHYNILSLAVDPKNSSTIWAGTSWGGGIFKSVDAGDSWQPMRLTPNHDVAAIAVSPENSDFVLAGLYGDILKSENGGQTWQETITEISSITGIIFDPRKNGTVYVSTEGMGVLVSKDQGETWENFSEGIFCPVVTDIAVSKEDRYHILAATYGSGVFQYPLDSNNSYQEAIIVLTDASPNATVEADSIAKIYGTNGANNITVGSGADIELINFPGENSLVIQSQSSFSVYRTGAMVILDGSDGTKIKIPATMTQQSIIFDDVEKILVIDSGRVMIGDQIVNLDSAAIE